MQGPLHRHKVTEKIGAYDGPLEVRNDEYPPEHSPESNATCRGTSTAGGCCGPFDSPKTQLCRLQLVVSGRSWQHNHFRTSVHEKQEARKGAVYIEQMVGGVTEIICHRRCQASSFLIHEKNGCNVRPVRRMCDGTSTSTGHWSWKCGERSIGCEKNYAVSVDLAKVRRRRCPIFASVLAVAISRFDECVETACVVGVE